MNASRKGLLIRRVSVWYLSSYPVDWCLLNGSTAMKLIAMKGYRINSIPLHSNRIFSSFTTFLRPSSSSSSLTNDQPVVREEITGYCDQQLYVTSWPAVLNRVTPINIWVKVGPLIKDDFKSSWPRECAVSTGQHVKWGREWSWNSPCKRTDWALFYNRPLALKLSNKSTEEVTSDSLALHLPRVIQ